MRFGSVMLKAGWAITRGQVPRFGLDVVGGYAQWRPSSRPQVVVSAGLYT